MLLGNSFNFSTAICNSSQRLEHLKRLQKEKINADRDIMEITNCSNEGKYNVL